MISPLRPVRPKTTKSVRGIRAVVAMTIVVVGMGIGIYIGIWVMLVGGIKQIVEAIEANPVSGDNVAWGIVKVLFFEVGILIGWASLGLAMMFVAVTSD